MTQTGAVHRGRCSHSASEPAVNKSLRPAGIFRFSQERTDTCEKIGNLCANPTFLQHTSKANLSRLESKRPYSMENAWPKISALLPCRPRTSLQRGCPRMNESAHVDFFVDQPLIFFARSGQLERVGDCRLAFFDAGDDVRAADPVGL